MANSIGNIDLSFIGTNALDVAQAKNLPFSVFSSRYEAGGVEGDVVKVYPLVAPTTAIDFNDSTNNYETGNADSETFIDVTLNKRKKTSFELSSDDYMRIGQKNLELKIKSYVSELVREANVTTMGLITNANFGAAVHTGVASTLDVDAIGVINADDDIQEWNSTGKMNMVLKPTYYQNVITEASIVNANQRGGRDANVNGIVDTDVLGWDMYQLKTVPANGENLVGFCTDGRGIAVAFGVKSDWDDKKTYFNETFVDPETGFTYKMVVTESQTTHNKVFHFESLYGVAKGQGDGLKRLVSA
jgi:hypothetical protein